MIAGGTVTIQATGRGGVPANARTVVVNVSVPGNTTSGYLTAYPGGTRPVTTSLTYAPGAPAFNQVTVKLSPTGTFTIWNSGGTADVIIDVMGSYVPLATYTYNGDGLRASRATTTGTQKFAWDPTSSVPLLLTDGSLNYIYDDAGNPLEQVDAAGVVLYYQHDQYGSTRLLTNATGAVAASYTYNAYGALTARTGKADTPLRWNGQYQDTDTGLYYLRARYYDPTTAQFITRDLLAAATGARYSYASGNPITGADPTGLDPHWWDNNEIYGAVLLGTYSVARWATTPVNLPNSRYFTGAGNMLYGGYKVGKGASLLVAGTGASATGVGLPPGAAVMMGGIFDIGTGGFKVYRGYGQFNDALSHPNVCKSPLDYGVGAARDTLPFGDNVVDILGGLP